MNEQLPISSQAALAVQPLKSTYPTNHLQNLLDGFCDLSGVENAGLCFKGLSLNSKKAHEEFLFLACAGVGNTSHHGIAYAGQAINQGASCVLWEPTSVLQEMPKICTVEGKPDVPLIRVEDLHNKSGLIAARFYQHPTRELNVIGITGTNGKTSTAHFIARLMILLNKKVNDQGSDISTDISPEDSSYNGSYNSSAHCAIIGTLGNGLYGQLQPSSHTTPDAVTLQQLMAEYREQGIKTVVMEVSSHALSQGRVNGVEFDVAVLTNLSRDHLDYHGDMQSYAAEKLKLFLTPGLKTMVLNQDDPFSEQIAEQLKAEIKPDSDRQIVSYAQHNTSADFSATDIQLDYKGIQFNLHHKGNAYAVASSLIGAFNIDNILAAIAVLATQGYELQSIIAAVKDLQTVPGRMEKINARSEAPQPLIIIDYAHTPDALLKAIQAVRAHMHSNGKLYCIFGCGGDRDQGKRAQMAKVAEDNADQLMVTSDNPRNEAPEQIIKDIISGFKTAQSVWTETDRTTAIAQVLKEAKPQDSVLIAGKGHENYQEIKAKRIPFSDKDCVMQFYCSGSIVEAKT